MYQALYWVLLNIIQCDLHGADEVGASGPSVRPVLQTRELASRD